MSLDAGRLRHRITIKDLVEEQDSDGNMERGYVPVWENVPAAIEPVGAREMLASKAPDSQRQVRITIRYRPGMKSSMRVFHGDLVYKPADWIPDKETGIEYLTAPCTLLESGAEI